MTFQPKYRGVWVNPHANADGTHDKRIRAEFDSESDANWWWQGIARPNFRIENMDGEEVVVRGIRERNGRLSHTEVVLASKDRAERAERERRIEASGLTKGASVRPLRSPRTADPGIDRDKLPETGRILGFVKDPIRWPVCVFWVAADDESKRFRAWYDFGDVELVNEEELSASAAMLREMARHEEVSNG